MLGFLANLRDIKASLTSGMILLFAIWLAFGNQIAGVKADDSVAGNVARLVDYLGPVATLGVVSFVAYFLGLILSLDRIVLGASRVLRSANANQGLIPAFFTILISTLEFIGATYARFFRVLFGMRAAKSRSTRTPAFRSPRLNGYVRQIVSDALDRNGQELVVKRLTNAASYSPTAPLGALLDFATPEGSDEDVDGVVSDYVLGTIRTDLDILAVQLGHKRERAYDRFEKARSEAEFRAAIVIPLILLTVILCSRLSMESASPGVITATLFTGLVGTVVLTVKAYRKMNESEEEVINAILLEEIEVPQLIVLKEPAL
ncbi:hypothetical protein IWX65_002733 [Arthrobacter sp. CAN_A214]|uniref:hypothetical protein n=1 Tax=Arthrobacter sp. CAN_A214 TaxID=2787720 RepID=UPI0018C97DD2